MKRQPVLEIFPWKQGSQVAHVPWATTRRCQSYRTLDSWHCGQRCAHSGTGFPVPIVSLKFYHFPTNMLVECWYRFLFDGCWCKESFCEDAKLWLATFCFEKVHSIGIPVEVTVSPLFICLDLTYGCDASLPLKITIEVCIFPGPQHYIRC